MKRLKVRTQLGLGFGAIALLIGVIIVSAIWSLTQLNRTVNDMAHDKFPKTVVANDIKTNIYEIGLAMRNLLIMHDAAKTHAQIEKILAARTAIKADVVDILPSPEGNGIPRLFQVPEV